MKLRQFIFIFLMSLLGLQFGVGQEKPKAVLIDETGKIDCCYPNFEILLQEIQNKDAKGYVIIYGDKNNKLKNLLYEQSIRSLYHYRNNPKIIILHGKNTDVINTKFWVVPNGAETPNFQEEKLDFSIFLNKPKRLYEWFYYFEGGSDGVCDMQFQELYTSKFLLANLDLNAHFIIYTKSTKDFRNIKSKLIKQFDQEFKVSSNRLRFFHIADENPVGNGEIWLVPKKNRH